MMDKKTIKIGTRGSKLAIYQAEKTREILSAYFGNLNFEIIIIKTQGDKILDVALSKIGDKGLFTKEIEDALLSGDIDMAVHSLKDLPTVLPRGLCIGGVLPRAEFRDALVSIDRRKISQLTVNDVIATSSLRRKAQLLRLNPDFNIVDIRGNVDTRLRKMREGHCTAMVMAAAGLQRLGLGDEIAEIISEDVIVPAVAQGIIAVECREADNDINSFLESINCIDTMIAAMAERTFLSTLEGGCQVPVGCYSSIVGRDFRITGYVSAIDGQNAIVKTLFADVEQACRIAERLALSMIAEGADDILKNIRK